MLTYSSQLFFNLSASENTEQYQQELYLKQLRLNRFLEELQDSHSLAARACARGSGYKSL